MPFQSDRAFQETPGPQVVDPRSPRTLDEARLSRDVFVVLEGSHNGQVYVSCQAVLVVCWEPVLKLLSRDLDAIASVRPGRDANIRFIRLPAAPARGEGAEGTRFVSGLWIDEQFSVLGLDRYIRGILRGRLGRLPMSERLRYAALNRVKYGAQLAKERVLRQV